MKVFKFILILFFPILVLADGIKISHYTLDAVKMAFLVKVLLYDTKRNTAKVEVLKKITRIEKDKATSIVEIGVSENSRPGYSDAEPIVEASNLEVGKTATVRMLEPVKFVPRRWVQEVRYWNSVRSVDAGNKSILIYSEGNFEFSPYSEENISKVEILFDPIKAEKKIADSSISQLKSLLLDEDFQEIVLKELIKRKSVTGEMIASITPKEVQFKIVTRFSNILADSERESFWLDYANEAAKGKIEIQRQFVQQFYYYSQIKSMDVKIKIYEKFSQADSDLRSQIHTFMREVRDSYRNNPKQGILPKIKNLYLENLRLAPNSLPDLYVADFFRDLPPEEKADFFEKVVDSYIPYGKKNSDMGPYESILTELTASENLKIAWKMTDLPLTDNSRKEKLFNAILKVIFAKENLADAQVKSKILKYIETYGNEARYPIEMEPEVKAKYNQIGGVRYDDLFMLRLVYPNNSDELAEKFTRYFEKALTVEVIETSTKNDKSTIKLKIEKNSGQLKFSEPNSNGYKVQSICKHAIPGETLLLSIDKESLETLKSTNLSRMILASRSDDYKFVILDTKYGSQIETLLLSQSK